ncbi:MAG: hypothetical protein K8F91_04820, partial [Candidatus Obscuribacterales bacterium]|nr:hypothetical protein [Candidatus Obscuribacterales bacterium]
IKTTEGSITFAIIAFFASLVALSSLSSLSQPDILLMSGVIALLAMLFEAIAWRGLDNIFIPVGSFFALQTHFHLTGQPLLIRLVILLAMASVLIVTRRKTTLEGSAVLAVVLFCYFAFVYGGMIWALSPALLYGSYRLLLPARFHNLTNSHSIYAVISVASAGLLWLLFASHHDAPQYLFPYSLAFAAHAAIISIAHMRFTGLDKPKVYAILFASLKAWCLLCLPFVILTPTSKLITLTFCLAPFCIAIPAMAFYLANSRHQVATDRPTRWIKQAIFAGLGSLIGLMPLVL